MIVNETAINQITVEIKLLQVPFQPSLEWTRVHAITENGPKLQNVKLFIKHDNQPNVLKKNGEQVTINN